MRQRIKAYFQRRSWFLLALICVTAASSKLPINHYGLDLLDHMQPYYFLGFALLAFSGFTYLQQKKMALIALLGLVGSMLVSLLPMHKHLTCSISKQGTFQHRTAHTLKAVVVNVLQQNDNYQAIEGFLLAEDADLLAIVEYHPRLSTLFEKKLSTHYPYYATYPHESPAGLAIFSKIPLHGISHHDPADDLFGLFSATIEVNKQAYNLIVAHPFPPIHQDGLLRRQKVQAQLAALRKDPKLETIVMGDLNNTLWSADFLHMLQELKLKVNLFTPGTWPALRLFPRIGIDHILIPMGAHFISMRAGPAIGSDHYPLIAEILL